MDLIWNTAACNMHKHDQYKDFNWDTEIFLQLK